MRRFLVCFKGREENVAEAFFPILLFIHCALYFNTFFLAGILEPNTAKFAEFAAFPVKM